MLQPLGTSRSLSPLPILIAVVLLAVLVAVGLSRPHEATASPPPAFGGGGSDRAEEHGGPAPRNAEPGGRQARKSLLRLTMDGDSMTWKQMVAVLEAGDVALRLSPKARLRMLNSRAGALAALKRQRVYGWNQALGPLKDRPLTTAEATEFQRRVLRSHAAGVGSALPDSVARLALVLRANAMARGRMGVRPELVDRMLALVNAGVLPKMPRIGPLGTGDLQPMAAAGLVLTGEPAPARFRGSEAPAPRMLRRAGLDPDFTLRAGEAIALISGNSVLSARFVAAARRAKHLADTFEGIFAMFLEATRAEKGAFDGRTHRERRIPAEIKAAARIRRLVCGSVWMTEKGRRRLGAEHPRVQDAVSVRAEPHILGALRQTLARVRTDLVREANASTSNPLVFPRRDGNGYEFVMGGNWDGDLLGHGIDTLNAQVADLGILSETLSNRLLASEWSYGLPPNLAGGKPGLNSGMVQVLTVATALVPEMQVRATPAATLSRSVKFGQEDHNPMSTASMSGLTENLDRLEIILAVQAMMSAQGIDLIRARMGELPLGTGSAMVHEVVRDHVAPLGNDRYLTPDLRRTIRLVRDGEIASTVRSALRRQVDSCAARDTA